MPVISLPLLLLAGVLFSIAGPAAVVAADDALMTLRDARALTCSLSHSAVATWQSDASDLEVRTRRRAEEVRFEAIDPGRGTARIVDGAAERSLHVFSSPSGLHFVEEAALGSVFVSTVFAAPGEGRFVFVTSRHVNAGGRPLPSQHHGTCTIDRAQTSS